MKQDIYGWEMVSMGPINLQEEDMNIAQIMTVQCMQMKITTEVLIVIGIIVMNVGKK